MRGNDQHCNKQLSNHQTSFTVRSQSDSRILDKKNINLFLKCVFWCLLVTDFEISHSINSFHTLKNHNFSKFMMLLNPILTGMLRDELLLSFAPLNLNENWIFWEKIKKFLLSNPLHKSLQRAPIWLSIDWPIRMRNFFYLMALHKFVITLCNYSALAGHRWIHFLQHSF